MTVERLDDEMSSAEMTHWQAFFRLEKEDLDRASKKGTKTASED